MGVLQQAVGQHIRRTLEDLLGGLEFQLDRAFQLVLVGLEQLCRAQQHGRVHIVAAAVHLAGHFRAARSRMVLPGFFPPASARTPALPQSFGS